MNIRAGEAKETRGGRKMAQVLAGAREVFMRDGFEGASVDEIARCAGVSKATLYSYFSDKRLLFLAVAQAECCRQEEAIGAMIPEAAKPAEVLRVTAERMMRLFLSRFGRNVFRICVAEADRFPELGREFLESGPGRVRSRLVAYFEEAIRRGELRIDDLKLAADQFIELCKADLFPQVMLGLRDEISEAELRRVADGAVETFLARYGA